MTVSPPPTPVPQEDPPLTVAEVAALLRVKDETVRTWLRDGDIRGIKAGTRQKAHWRIPRSEIDKLRHGR